MKHPTPTKAVLEAFAYDLAVSVRQHMYGYRPEVYGPVPATVDEVFVVLSGNCDIAYDEIWHPAPERSLVYIRRGTRYALRQSNTSGLSRHTLTFLFSAPPKWKCDLPKTPIKLTSAWWNALMKIDESCNYDSHGQRVALAADLMQYLQNLAAALNTPAAPNAVLPARRDTESDWMEIWARAQDLLDKDAASKLTVRRLAEALHVSHTKLRQVFMAASGVAPKAVLVSKRMLRAKDLIQKGKLNLSEVARATGYHSLQQFSAAFKRHFGRSPTAFSKDPW
ncbi:MAG TPA: AraC family transcriptional regulator [Planctomycetota bacterium]|nr:AraC family transcriptional regulator [Planctomycetota bacterium]